jgi:hypothetical protein
MEGQQAPRGQSGDNALQLWMGPWIARLSAKGASHWLGHEGSIRVSRIGAVAVWQHAPVQISGPVLDGALAVDAVGRRCLGVMYTRLMHEDALLISQRVEADDAALRILLRGVVGIGWLRRVGGGGRGGLVWMGLCWAARCLSKGGGSRGHVSV